MRLFGADEAYRVPAPGLLAGRCRDCAWSWMRRPPAAFIAHESVLAEPDSDLPDRSPPIDLYNEFLCFTAMVGFTIVDRP